jgi:hypothetical protein
LHHRFLHGGLNRRKKVLDNGGKLVYMYMFDEEGEAYFETPCGKLHEMYLDIIYGMKEELNYGY